MVEFSKNKMFIEYLQQFHKIHKIDMNQNRLIVRKIGFVSN